MTDPRPGDLFAPGDLVNNTYRIEAILGRGGTSDVYRARSEISGRLVAIKVLKAEFAGNMDYLSLLTREEEMREIRHDAVVRYSENSRTPEGHVYLLMDYVDGPGLDRKLREGPMGAEEILTICRRVASGLEAAHRRNIVHRDLSPDNIILKEDDPAQAVIIDFGIAKDTNPGAQTIVGNEFAGKYAYAAPEQLAGKTDARTDLYSLGALLLACFRGKKPDVGSNPMEVVQKKSRPLDLEGVPEPLAGIIARMTDPDPARRFQSAAEVIAAIDNGGAGDPPTPAATAEEEDDEDRTVIVPVTAPQTPKEEIAGTAPAPSASKAKPAERKPSRTGWLAAGLIVASLAVLAGLWVSGMLEGLIGPRYPEAAPFELVLDRNDGQPLSASGHVPSEDMRASLTAMAEQEGGAAELTLASGAIGDSWGADVMTLVDRLSPLDDWRVALSGNQAEVTGRTSDEALADDLRAAFADGLPGVLEGTAQIAYEPPFLAASALQSVLDEMADCGRLSLVDPPATGYGPGQEIAVQGTLSGEDASGALRQALQGVAGPRPVRIDAEVLNPNLCLIENFLPRAPASDISIRFAEGADATLREDGTYVVGENPVIDVMLPEDVTDGYLSVSILDVTGNVFHLLPNRTRPDNSVEALRDGREGEVPVRVAFDVASSQEDGTLAFQVDDSTLGKSKVVVIHSTAPLFDSLRPTTESASGYAQALRDNQRSDDARITSLDSRILVTAAQ
ncbi:protein kinase [Aquicoccus sp. SCR17]|nr:protein kinase [Carideicomes alvinocaridis]